MPTPTSTSSILFEHLSPSARETSPPAKVRTPSVRMTISEKNKRANQILEYICSLQVEITTGKKRTKERLLQEEKEEEEEENELCKKRKLIDAQMNETMTRKVIPEELVSALPVSMRQGASQLALQQLNCLDLIDTIISLVGTAATDDIKVLMDRLAIQAPELLMIGLAQIQVNE